MTNDSNSRDHVLDLIRKSRVAMLTHLSPAGDLVSHPMASQDVEFDGTILFIAERSSKQVTELQQNPTVNLAYSNHGSWVSVAGTAAIVNDTDKLKELWSTFTDAWLEGGPENPENVLVEVTPKTAEYWEGPGGSTVIQLANLVKAKVTGERLEGDNEVVDLT